MDRRERLLAVGIELFGRRRYEDVSAQEIAEFAGVAHGLLFHYFGSKRDFFCAVLEDIAEIATPRFEANTAADPARWLRKELEITLDDTAERGEVFASVIHGSLGADLAVQQVFDEMRRRAIDRLLAKLEPERETPLLIAAVWAWSEMLHELAGQWLDSGRTIPKRHIMALVIAGLNSQLRTVAAIDKRASFDPERFAEA